MKVLMYVLNNADLLSPLLKEFDAVGVHGCTILDSSGMGRELAKDNDEFGIMFGGLSRLLKPKLQINKTLMLVLEDSHVSTAVAAIEKVVGNLDIAGNGIMFTFELDLVKGIKTYGNT